MRYTRKLTVTAFAAALIALGTGEAQAQSASATAKATINIPTVLFLEIDDTEVTFPEIGVAEFEAGHVEADRTTTVTTKGNVPHKVTIAAEAPNFSGGSAPSAENLTWSVDGSSFTALSTSETDLVTGLDRGVNDMAAEVSYRFELDWADPDAAPTNGDATLDFTYTAVSTATP